MHQTNRLSLPRERVLIFYKRRSRKRSWYKSKCVGGWLSCCCKGKRLKQQQVNETVVKGVNGRSMVRDICMYVCIHIYIYIFRFPFFICYWSFNHWNDIDSRTDRSGSLGVECFLLGAAIFMALKWLLNLIFALPIAKVINDEKSDMNNDGKTKTSKCSNWKIM